MPTNGQQFGSDYFTTTSIYMNDLMSNVREEYANRLEREQSYNEWLQQRIDGLDDTIRQFGVIRDTQEHREMGYYFQLAGLDDRQQRRVSSASRVALRATGNLVEDVRENFRKGMSGEAGENMALARILNSGLDMEGMAQRIVQEINENPTMGRLLGEEFLSPAGGGGQGHIAAQIGGGLGISDALMRLDAASRTGFTDDQLRDLGAQTVGLESGAALSEEAAVEAQRLLSSQTLTQTANIPTISGIHAYLREQAPSWGLTPEMVRAEVELAGAQEQRAELRGELDARLQEQQSRDPDAEIESAFRDRLGPVGEGAQFSDTVLGTIQREHAGRRRRERTERIRNMSQSERILMGSVGEAREMALSFGNDAVREGASWDAARALEVMARGNGIADNEKLVNLAAGWSNGDNNLRDEILRNYLYMRQIERNGTELNSSPEERERRLNDRLRDAVQRTGEDYRSNDAARISDAQTEVAQRNVHGPITSTGSDGWADYNLHENGIISYRHPEDNRLRRVPRGDPQYNRLLAVINGEEVPEARGTDPASVEGGSPDTVPPVGEGSPNATPATAIEALNAEAAAIWADESRTSERAGWLERAQELGAVTPAVRGNPPRVGVGEAAGVGTELSATTLKEIQALEEMVAEGNIAGGHYEGTIFNSRWIPDQRILDQIADLRRGYPLRRPNREQESLQNRLDTAFANRSISERGVENGQHTVRTRTNEAEWQAALREAQERAEALGGTVDMNIAFRGGGSPRVILPEVEAPRWDSKFMQSSFRQPSDSAKTAYDATEEALRDGAGR